MSAWLECAGLEFKYGGQGRSGSWSYIRTYEEGGTVTVNLIRVYGGRIVSKQQSTLVPNKTACAEGVVLMASLCERA